MHKLALYGGTPLMHRKSFPQHPVISSDEIKAVTKVLKSGKLSSFIAARGNQFLGGERVREFERLFCEYHDVKYAVAFNSATAALHAAVVACGVQPGDEVLVPPYTFTSTATCALMHNAIPVFCDIENETFCLDADKIDDTISPFTKAMIPVHLFGHAANMDKLLKKAKDYNLKVIEDCAQAPGATWKNKKVGTFGDCGIFSFTENKNITTGEGGMLITNDEAIAEGARLVRNHGEAVWDGMTERTYTSTMLGWNYRMTEMEAAMGIAQFIKLDALNGKRIELSNHLTEKLKCFDFITTPITMQNCKHVYYIYALKYSEEIVGIQRNLFVKALNAEGIPFGAGYIKPLYLSPLYQNKNHFAFKHYSGDVKYNNGTCPVAEKMHFDDVMITLLPRFPALKSEMDYIIQAFEKIVENKDEFFRNI